mmetsp:Transcript_54076/g.128801  ORF Transcript_54076/g.128801 Transcript_54076/m.128801 type:complete len:241 (-) Transcript_54076:237-959(-)
MTPRSHDLMVSSEMMEDLDEDSLIEPRHGIIVGPTLGREGPQVSQGSIGHPNTCVACAFYCYSLRGCAKGRDCSFCHMRHVKKVRRGRGRRSQKGQLDQEEEQDVQQQGGSMSSNGSSSVGSNSNGSSTSCSSGSGASTATTTSRTADTWRRGVSERDSSGSDCSTASDGICSAVNVDACLSLLEKHGSTAGAKDNTLEGDLVQLLRTIKEEFQAGRSGQPFMAILMAGWGPIHELEVLV